MHDGAIQSLFGIDMKLEAIRREPSALGPGVDDELAQVQGLLRHEVLSLRELMQALRPIELDSSEQVPDVLASLVERFRRDTGISARFVVGEGRIALRPGRALELVRLVQEALVNVRKHSRAKNVLVRLAPSGDACALVVEDDGCGFDFEGRLTGGELDARRLGPTIIKERVRQLGAELSIDSTPDGGARIEVHVPQDL
ncbi:MAG: histidine kinase [Vicinamibacterales bacterium]